MRNEIEEFYYDNIRSAECGILEDSVYMHFLELMINNEEELRKTLTGTQLELYKKIKEYASELYSKNEQQSLNVGVKFAVILLVEAMITP